MGKLTEQLKLLMTRAGENYFAIALIILAISLRIMPHPANFAPVGAIALFGGVYLKKKQAVWIPLCIMIVSDLIIGLHSTIAFTWGSFVAMALVGIWISSHKNIQNVIAGTAAGSLIFFFVTNFGVWVATPLYAKNLPGLLTCYVRAIPFFRNTLASDFLFVAVLFGAYELAARYLFEQKLVKVKA